ncbi:hypothetical protein QR680_004608 [Steinernema hermaphroditum]|uniref:Uncharacterized protein n=1 Tax=Steinernema hermaphroditum TaxID=289476 RepID=A0AA39HQN8_9BILA|nr:hypothetical protein QR680_004608 [Steinernema hermaphroditum]
MGLFFAVHYVTRRSMVDRSFWIRKLVHTPPRLRLSSLVSFVCHVCLTGPTSSLTGSSHFHPGSFYRAVRPALQSTSPMQVVVLLLLIICLPSALGVECKIGEDGMFVSVTCPGDFCATIQETQRKCGCMDESVIEQLEKRGHQSNVDISIFRAQWEQVGWSRICICDKAGRHRVDRKIIDCCDSDNCNFSISSSIGVVVMLAVVAVSLF